MQTFFSLTCPEKEGLLGEPIQCRLLNHNGCIPSLGIYVKVPFQSCNFDVLSVTHTMKDVAK